MNDPRELVLGLDRILETLKLVRHDEFAGERGGILSILAARISTFIENFNSFCCCFSLAGDELPLWREYTGLKGLCIGFKPTALNDIQARLQKVGYLEDSTPATLKAKIIDIANELQFYENERDPKTLITATVNAIAIITALKHQSWAYEQEIRMIHVQTKSEPNEEDGTWVSIDGEIDEWIKPSTRLSGGNIVEYLEFPFGRYRLGDKKHTRAIDSVIIGPACQLSKTAVLNLLYKYGYDNVNVKKSDCKIRTR